MADETIKISGPIHIDSTTKEHVALKLAEKITGYESSDVFKKDRKYWLTLYRQCYKATNGAALSTILEEQ